MSPSRDRGAVAAGAPVRVAERLRRAPDGPVPVLHHGRHAVYVDLDGWCLGVVSATAAQVPCALRLAAPDLGDLTAGTAQVRGGTLVLDGTPLRVGRFVDVRVPGLGAATTGGAEPETRHVAHELGLPEDPATPVTDPARWADRLVGRGSGLTPLGDDVLCGWLAVHRAGEVPTPTVDAAVRAALPRTTLLSATLLDCALHGEVLPQFASYVVALGTAAEPDRAANLAALGHTSGAGLLHGARIALHAVSPHLAPQNGAAA